jgi:Ser/Thr protein kinase RdoA (MazF antagonist)
MHPYAARTHRGQLAVLRPTATAALRRFPVEPVRVRVINHGYNTTYRVDTADGRRFALRLNINSRRDPAVIAAEVAWTTALAADTGVWVPTATPTRDGEPVAVLDCAALGRPVAAVLFSWLPGRDLWGRADAAQVRAVGAAMAMLHEHGRDWQPPAPTRLDRLDDPMLGQFTPDYRDDPRIDTAAGAVLDEVYRRCQQTLDALFEQGPVQPIHADLHLGNVKGYRGRVSVFDFDDCGLGVTVQDLAISAYYLRLVGLDQQLLEGYATIAAPPSCPEPDFEALVAGRNLAMLTHALQTSTAEIRAMLDAYIPNSLLKLRGYLQTGRYRHDVPGLRDLPT